MKFQEEDKNLSLCSFLQNIMENNYRMEAELVALWSTNIYPLYFPAL